VEGLGYKVQNLDCPDNDSLRFGKEFGNRGQCNPTYYTVGNLIKYLKNLRDVEGMSPQEINENYVFLTAGACGPCRFGMYEAEYRKALTDAGFPNFRVMTFEQKVNLGEIEEMGLKVDFNFIRTLVKCFIVGDLLNAMGYRIRPYEVQPGETDKVIAKGTEMLYEALNKGKSLTPVLFKIRKLFAAIEVNYLQPKPVVEIIGEFWAMTTEGDGNYKIQRWLEQEGAEVRIQQVTFWIEYIIWEGESFFKSRINLKQHDEKGLKHMKAKKTLRLLYLAKKLLRMYYHTYAWAVGYKDAKMPDMDAIAKYAHEHYNTNLRGGEGHMEVGKVIEYAKKKKCHMVLSVKPFGCMPSSSVSDGVQSLIQELYPEIIFYPIETSGDGAVNVYSRVQMMLHKARKAVKEEFESVLSEKNTSLEELNAKLANNKKLQKGSHKSKSRKTSTASNMVYDLV
ncbi:MAG: 2-hydroxyglutaryl-CoA dehydratase, partial [Spirochaetota bacterium]|nr:2-hydroxyglutaryl-CoA dehydratase [Spirochaetota bacterium]